MKKVLGGCLSVIGAGVVLLVVLALVIGGGSGSSSSSSDSGTAKTEAAESGSKKEKKDDKKDEAKEEAAQEADEGPSIATDSKYAVTINGMNIVEDYDGAPCIAIDFTFTNVSDDSPTSMSLATNITVYQDGVECEDAYFADSNDGSYSNKVKAGVSVDVTRVYKLQNTSSDVEVEVGELFSWSDDLLAYEVFKLS